MANGTDAAQVMLGFKTWRPGHCLEAVVAAYRRVGIPSLGRPAPTAYVGWQNSDLKHPGDRNPPAGVPVWFGPKPSSSAGDVVISLGNGQVVATDWPRSGVIGVTSITARQNQIGRPYLGWTGDILGAPIQYNSLSGNTTSEEDDMTPDQDARLRNIEALLAGGGPSLTDPAYRAAPGTVLQHLQNLTGFVYAGGTSAADPKYRGAPGTIYALLKTPVQRTVNGKTVEIDQIQELADSKTVGMRTEAKVDALLSRPLVIDDQVRAIADAVAAQLGTPTFTLDYAEIAKAVNDDAAKRLAS